MEMTKKEEMAYAITNFALKNKNGEPVGSVADNYARQIAEVLYNAGYRKTFTSDLASDTQKAYKEGYQKGLDDGVELNKAFHNEKCAEFNKLCYDYGKLTMEKDYLKKALDNAVKINEAGEKELVKVRKQTAKEILQSLYDHCFELVDPFNNDCEESYGQVEPSDILHLAEEYGVEVDE